MADVLLGVASGPKGFNKLLVVKRLRIAGPRRRLLDDHRSMFLDEARLAARLSHPNVVHTYEIGEAAKLDGYFIVDGVPRGALSQPDHRRHEGGGTTLPPQVWAKIVADALAGLHHAHELCDYDGTSLNVVHRDVSPQNIIVTFDGRVKIVDFGIAKAAVNVTETEAGMIKGKIAYMAPEQAIPGSVPVDRRADLFAMGIVLWECLTMERLITGDAGAAARKIRDMDFLPPSRLNPIVPTELDAITLRALERDPAKRFQTADEMEQGRDVPLRGARHVPEEEIGRLVSKPSPGAARRRAGADPDAHEQPGIGA